MSRPSPISPLIRSTTAACSRFSIDEEHAIGKPHILHRRLARVSYEYFLEVLPLCGDGKLSNSLLFGPIDTSFPEGLGRKSELVPLDVIETAFVAARPRLEYHYLYNSTPLPCRAQRI